MLPLNIYLMLSSLVPSTTYGYGERNCGDVGHAAVCDVHAVTSSGIPFDPAIAQVAIAAPIEFPLEPTYIGLKVPGRACHRVLLADKMNARYIGVRGFDLTPAAVTLLTGESANPAWSGLVQVCLLVPQHHKQVKNHTRGNAHGEPSRKTKAITAPTTRN